ncbi:MAG: hypothetical protein C4329_15635 [Chitinophagaceae bacterium]
MNNNKERATQVAVNEKRTDNSSAEKMSSDADDTNTRSFGSATLWRIRKNARSFKIHNRMPRL